MRLAFVISLLMWLGISFLVTGCSGSTGWQVGFGIYPVTSIENQQKLSEQKTNK